MKANQGIKMYEISKNLDQQTLETVLLQAWTAFLQCEHASIAEIERCTTIRQEITSLLYIYLEKYNLIREIVPICKKLLIEKDLPHFKKLHSYNYQKLLITLNTTYVQNRNSKTD